MCCGLRTASKNNTNLPKSHLSSSPMFIRVTQPENMEAQPESRIFEGSASRRHERQPDLQCCSDLKSFLEWWATIGELQRHCWIWGLERKGLDGCGCGLRHNYGCCPCLICNLYFSRDAAAIPSQYPVRPSPAWCFNMAGPQCWTSAWARIILYLAFSCDGLPPQYTPSSLHSHGVSAWRI